MKKIIICILIITANCGKKSSTRLYSTTDSEFEELIGEFKQKIDEFKMEGYFQGVVPVNFHDTGNPLYAGVCNKYPDGTREIFINKEYWGEVSSSESQTRLDIINSRRRLLLFHELGHCILNRGHQDNTVGDFIKGSGQDSYINKKLKISIMNTHLISINIYEKYREGYIKELFTSNPNTLLSLFKKPDPKTEIESSNIEVHAVQPLWKK